MFHATLHVNVNVNVTGRPDPSCTEYLQLPYEMMLRGHILTRDLDADGIERAESYQGSL